LAGAALAGPPRGSRVTCKFRTKVDDNVTDARRGGDTGKWINCILRDADFDAEKQQVWEEGEVNDLR
jgi:hypothetical protein